MSASRPTSRAGALGREIERMRLEHRARRLDLVMNTLRERATFHVHPSVTPKRRQVETQLAELR